MAVKKRKISYYYSFIIVTSFVTSTQKVFPKVKFPVSCCHFTQSFIWTRISLFNFVSYVSALLYISKSQDNMWNMQAKRPPHNKSQLKIWLYIYVFTIQWVFLHHVSIHIFLIECCILNTPTCPWVVLDNCIFNVWQLARNGKTWKHKCLLFWKKKCYVQWTI